MADSEVVSNVTLYSSQYPRATKVERMEPCSRHNRLPVKSFNYDGVRMVSPPGGPVCPKRGQVSGPRRQDFSGPRRQESEEQVNGPRKQKSLAHSWISGPIKSSKDEESLEGVPEIKTFGKQRNKDRRKSSLSKIIALILEDHNKVSDIFL